MEGNFPTDQGWGGVGWGDGSGGNAGNASDGDRWGAADEALFACPPLTSCCAARFLTGRGLSSAWALGTPALENVNKTCTSGLLQFLPLSPVPSLPSFLLSCLLPILPSPFTNIYEVCLPGFDPDKQDRVLDFKELLIW